MNDIVLDEPIDEIEEDRINKEPRVERCAACGNERDAAIEVHADPGAAWPFHPYTPKAL